MNALRAPIHAQIIVTTRLDHLLALVSVGLSLILTNQLAKIKMNVLSTYMIVNIPQSASIKWVISNVIAQWDTIMLPTSVLI